MKNTILGVILAYIIPHVSTDIWFIATWMMVGATVALALAPCSLWCARAIM